MKTRTTHSALPIKRPTLNVSPTSSLHLMASIDVQRRRITLSDPFQEADLQERTYFKTGNVHSSLALQYFNVWKVLINKRKQNFLPQFQTAKLYSEGLVTCLLWCSNYSNHGTKHQFLQTASQENSRKNSPLVSNFSINLSTNRFTNKLC